jgi:hypothetical protein
MNDIVFISSRRPSAIVQLYWREVPDILPTDLFLAPKTISARGCLAAKPPGVLTPRRGGVLRRGVTV